VILLQDGLGFPALPAPDVTIPFLIGLVVVVAVILWIRRKSIS